MCPRVLSCCWCCEGSSVFSFWLFSQRGMCSPTRARINSGGTGNREASARAEGTVCSSAPEPPSSPPPPPTHTKAPPPPIFLRPPATHPLNVPPPSAPSHPPFHSHLNPPPPHPLFLSNVHLHTHAHTHSYIHIEGVCVTFNHASDLFHAEYQDVEEVGYSTVTLTEVSISKHLY